MAQTTLVTPMYGPAVRCKRFRQPGSAVFLTVIQVTAAHCETVHSCSLGSVTRSTAASDVWLMSDLVFYR
jgi:hypothetical protein